MPGASPKSGPAQPCSPRRACATALRCCAHCRVCTTIAKPGCKASTAGRRTGARSRPAAALRRAAPPPTPPSPPNPPPRPPAAVRRFATPAPLRLLAPRASRAGAAAGCAMKAAALLQAKDVQVDFTVRGRRLQAVAGVTLCLAPAEALGLVGESGCGKSTFGRALVRLVQPTAGTVCCDGIDVTRLDMSRLRIVRRRMPIVFQDPISSLNRRSSIGQTNAEPMRYAGLRDPAAQARQPQALLERVGLDPALAAPQPHQLSGGQCQRVSIARELAAGPPLLTCDEPASALDVSVQAQIVNLLQDLRRARALALLFISHDLAVVRRIADRVAVMYLG